MKKSLHSVLAWLVGLAFAFLLLVVATLIPLDILNITALVGDEARVLELLAAGADPNYARNNFDAAATSANFPAGRVLGDPNVTEAATAVANPNPSADHATAGGATPRGAKEGDVAGWLLGHLPLLSEEDEARYRDVLVERGFEPTEILELLCEEHLDFMKLGHRVWFAKKLAERRGD